jgi:hypothetical protein
VRIFRHLLMFLAMLSLVGLPASASTGMYGRTVTLHASNHHHHGIDVANAVPAAAADHEHHVPGNCHPGKCCDSACCAPSYLSVSFEPVLFGRTYVGVAKVQVLAGDRRPDGMIPFPPNRPPITT